MNNILTISGWAQNPYFLNQTLNIEADILDYMKDDIDQVSKNLKGKKYDKVIGWSEGGQLALKFSRMLKVKELILIATPYQFIDQKYGIRKELFDNFYDEVKKDKTKLLKKFQSLILIGNKNAKKLREKLELGNYNQEQLLYWLCFLKNFNGLFYKDFAVNTKLIYSRNDKIVHHQQGEFYQNILANSELFLLDDAGHFPVL